MIEYHHKSISVRIVPTRVAEIAGKLSGEQKSLGGGLMEKVRMRVYLLSQKEVFELLATVEGKDYIAYRGEFDLGESAVDLLYGTFKGIFDFLSEEQSNREKLLGHTEHMVYEHPYFGMAAQTAHHAPSALPGLVSQLRTIQEDIQVLVSQCLNGELWQESTVPELYSALLEKGVFPVRELTYEKIKTEIVPAVPVQSRKRGLMPELLTAAELRERGIKTTITEVLYPETVTDLYCYLKAHYLRHAVRFKPCKHCGRYFVVTGSSAAEYCSRPIPGSTKTCRQIGAVRVYQSRQLANPAIRAFTKSYKTHNARVRYGTLTHEQFAAWSKEARAKRDECVSGKLSLEDFQTWLDTH